MHPRGPLPPGVYWRRRLIVLAAALLVLVVLAKSCAGGKSNDKGTKATAGKTTASSSQSSKSTGSATPGPTSPKPSGGQPSKSPASQPTKPGATTGPATSAQPSKSPSADPSTQCAAPGLQLSVKTDALQYAAGVDPVITMTIKNAGPTACTRDIGSGATGLMIKSGTDRIWSSDDCLPGGAPKNTVLKPGEVKTIAVTWNRKRSNPGTPCVGAAALPGHYRVFGQLADLAAAPLSFNLS